MLQKSYIIKHLVIFKLLSFAVFLWIITKNLELLIRAGCFMNSFDSDSLAADSIRFLSQYNELFGYMSDTVCQLLLRDKTLLANDVYYTENHVNWYIN